MTFNKKEYNKKYKQENKDKIKIYQKEYSKKHYQQNKETYSKQGKVWREKNGEYVKKYNKTYYPKNKDMILKKQKEYNKKEDIKSKRNKMAKHRRKIDLNYYIKGLIRGRFTKVIKKYSETGKIQSSNEYGIDFNSIIEHLIPFPKNIKNCHIHHIKPLFTFDFNNPKHIKKAFAPENHKWLTIKEHRKINHINNKIEEFLK